MRDPGKDQQLTPVEVKVLKFYMCICLFELLKKKKIEIVCEPRL